MVPYLISADTGFFRENDPHHTGSDLISIVKVLGCDAEWFHSCLSLRQRLCVQYSIMYCNLVGVFLQGACCNVLQQEGSTVSEQMFGRYDLKRVHSNWQINAITSSSRCFIG